MMCCAFYWQGKYTDANNGQISSIGLDIPGSSFDILLKPNDEFPDTMQQRFFLDVTKKQGGQSSQARRYKCLPEVAKTIKFAANVFHFHEDKSILNHNLDGTFSHPTFATKSVVPIDIESLPDFEENQYYRFTILNSGGNLKATCQKIGQLKTLQDFDKYDEEEIKKQNEALGKLRLDAEHKKFHQQLQTNVQAVNKGASPSEIERNEQFAKSISSVVKGFTEMTKAAIPTDQSANTETTETLQKKLAEEKEKLKAARISYDAACSSGDQQKIFSELQKKQVVMAEVLRLQQALQARGIPQENLGECVIS